MQLESPAADIGDCVTEGHGWGRQDPGPVRLSLRVLHAGLAFSQVSLCGGLQSSRLTSPRLVIPEARGSLCRQDTGSQLVRRKSQLLHVRSPDPPKP